MADATLELTSLRPSYSMPNINVKTVTIIYYHDASLELMHSVETLIESENGRVVIPNNFKKGKSIIAVCEGTVNILNSIGDRILTDEDVA